MGARRWKGGSGAPHNKYLFLNTGGNGVMLPAPAPVSKGGWGSSATMIACILRLLLATHLEHCPT